jgi:ADP-ribose pyrophosphatase YjhB (NUDIX family)
MSEKREYPSHPLVGVGVVVFRETDVLLIRRGKPPRLGEWSLPGGAQLLGETVVTTAAREVEEETGVTFTDLQFLEVIDIIFRDQEDAVQYHYTILDYSAIWESGEPRPGDDAMDAKFVSLQEIPQLGLWEKTVAVIQEAARQRLPSTPL